LPGTPIFIERRGLMFVLSSPSGAGKSTICRNLLRDEPELEMSVSVTTRKRRGNEVDGTDYRFISKRDFAGIQSADGLLESAEVHGNYYGTPREPAEKAMTEGRDMLFDIDYQGALQLFKKARTDVVSIFILPPSMVELRSRLERRAEDAPDIIDKRLQNSRIEIEHWGEYDFVVINDDLDKAFSEVSAILTAERLRRDRRPGLHDFVGSLLS
jgi:guanylate kinase